MMAQISLDPNADASIRVTQRGPVKLKSVDFKVLAAALRSPYWVAFLRHINGAPGFKPNNTHVEDTGITVVAVEIVLRALHQAYHQRKTNGHDPSSTEGKVEGNESVATSGASNGEDGAPGFDAASVNQSLLGNGKAVPPLDSKDLDVYFPQELFKADIDDVWGVAALVNLEIFGKTHKGKFDIDWTVVQPWFLKWRETSFMTFNTQADFEKVLFPTFAFEDPKGFRFATKWLCQNTSVGQIAEYSPLVHSQGAQWYLHLHLPPEVMCKFPRFLGLPLTYTDRKVARIRVARSQLRTKVSDQVWSLIRGHDGWLLHSDKCACWVVAHYNYLKALEKARVLCPELDHKLSILELVERMKTVQYEEPLDACMKCSNANIESHLRAAIHIGSKFDGVPMPELPQCDKKKKIREKRQQRDATA